MNNETITGVTCPKCLKRFDSPQALRMHHVRVHTMAGRRGAIKGAHAGNMAQRKSFPSDNKEYKQRKYREQVARYRAAGLTAQGKPYKDNAVSRGVRQALGITVKARKNMKTAQQQRRAKEKQQLLNGAVQQPSDNLGDSARAVIMAAQVLRAVSLGIKL